MPEDEVSIEDAGDAAALQGSGCSPAGGEEPAAAPAFAESALSPAGKAGGRSGK